MNPDKLPPTFQDLVRESREAKQAALDLDQAYHVKEREIQEAHAKARLILQRKDETLGNYRDVLACITVLENQLHEMAEKGARARRRSLDCYDAAVALLIKDSGLPEGILVRSRYAP